MSTSLHDTDLVAWAQQSAALLREGAELGPEECDQIAMELYDMAGDTRREMKSRAVSLIMHMLKIHFQPENRTISWIVTIANQRRELGEVLNESPSLMPLFREQLSVLHASAKHEAELETQLKSFPQKIPSNLNRFCMANRRFHLVLVLPQ